jgi:hypothetical protein
MVGFVPSEVIGIYIAGVGIVGPVSMRMEWGLLVLALLVASTKSSTASSPA